MGIERTERIGGDAALLGAQSLPALESIEKKLAEGRGQRLDSAGPPRRVCLVGEKI